MKTGRTLQQMALELSRQAHSMRDLIVQSRDMHFLTDGEARGILTIDGDPVSGSSGYTVSELARRQLAEKLAIPFPYFERMRKEQPELLDRNVNTWLQAPDADARMVRTLDGQVRALLSTKYRRIDNYTIFATILPLLEQLPGAEFKSLELTSQRMYLKVVTNRIQFEVQPGDVVQAGVMISNSEVGCGSLKVLPLLFRLVCTNGMVCQKEGMMRTHLGRNISADEQAYEMFKDDTVKADDDALMLKIRDVVQSAVSQATLDMLGAKLRTSLGIQISGDPVKSVQVLANRFDMDHEERDGVMRRLIEGADLTGYGLINAVTRHAQDIVDYDRATEFETIGGKMLDATTVEWKSVVEAK